MALVDFFFRLVRGQDGTAIMHVKRIILIYHQIFLCLVFLLLPYFLHQHTLAITQELGPVFVYAFCKVIG